MKHGDELVRRCVAVRGRHNVLGDRVEDGGVILEHVNVEHLLRVVESKMLELGVKTRPLGAEIGYP